MEILLFDIHIEINGKKFGGLIFTLFATFEAKRANGKSFFQA
jgi:hypothetical protein